MFYSHEITAKGFEKCKVSFSHAALAAKAASLVCSGAQFTVRAQVLLKLANNWGSIHKLWRNGEIAGPKYQIVMKAAPVKKQYWFLQKLLQHEQFVSMQKILCFTCKTGRNNFSVEFFITRIKTLYWASFSREFNQFYYRKWDVKCLKVLFGTHFVRSLFMLSPSPQKYIMDWLMQYCTDRNILDISC